MARAVRDLFRHKAGNVALITALLAPVLVLMAGGILDLSSASSRQAALQQAADAAAVGAVSRASPAYQASLNMNSDGTITASNLQSNAQAIFTANLKSAGNMTTPTFNVSVVKTGTTVSSTVSATSTYTPLFLGLIGNKSVALAVTSHASDNIPAYMNFYLLLDNTPSMGIAATQAGIQTMVNNTSDQCAFACHDVSNSNNYYNLAKSLGVSTRASVVAQAAANLLKTAQNTETSNGISNEFSVAVYDFGAAATDPTSSSYTGFSQVFPSSGGLSSNLSAAATAAAGIDIMTVNGQGQFNDEDTSLESPLVYAAKYLPSSGAGASPSNAKQVLFFVTDGMDDTYNCSRNDSATCRYIQPLNSSSYFPSPTACDTLKSKGVIIAILYTAQYSLPTNSFFMTYVNPYNQSPNPQIETNLQKCATLYQKVQTGGDINSAVQQLLQAVLASVRITG